MEKQFKYVFNGEEKSKEQFIKLAKDSFKWFSDNTIQAVDLDSVSKFFSGKYKSDNEIDKHFRGVLENHEKAGNDGSLTAEEKRIWTMLNPVLKVNLKEREYPNLGDYLNKEQKVIEDWNKKEPVKVYNYLDDLISAEKQKEKAVNSYSQGSREDVLKRAGIKESQSTEKAPIFTYCKVNKNALEALSLRALYGHIKYEEGNDWENFSRVPNGDFEYSNAMFRHALGIGGEETEKEHLVSTAWNAISRLEIYLRKNSK